MEPNKNASVGSLYVQAHKLLKEDRIEEANAICEQMFSVSKENIHERDFEDAVLFIGLASSYERKGFFDKAEMLYKWSTVLAEKIVGAEHNGFAATLACLAEFYAKQERHTEADVLMHRTITICEKELGPMSTFVGMYCRKYLKILQKQGRTEEAETLKVRIRAIRKENRQKNSSE